MAKNNPSELKIVEIDLSKVEAAALREVLADSGKTLQEFMRLETRLIVDDRLARPL